MKILIMGGTRFVGVSLTKLLVSQGHEVVLCNRGNRPAPVPHVSVILADRTDPVQLQTALQGQQFDVIFDNNGRELQDSQPLIDRFCGEIRNYIYMSSAGVYLESTQLPHYEGDPTDPQSRHRGKLDTEAYLQAKYQTHQFPYTAIRPTYIYGPQNYNDIEAWFFDRLVHDRPILLPDGGLVITQLGHVEDLAKAMSAILDQPKAVGQIYNISDRRFVSFLGLAQACAVVAGKPDYDKFVFYDSKKFNTGKRKAFPLRNQHFFASVEKAMQELSWTPEYDLYKGLATSWEDYLRSGRDKTEKDFTLDEQILGAL
jgi:UDP-glucose 4-epimerase